MDKKVIITSDWETCYLVKYRHEYEKKWVECRKDESIFSGEYFEVIEEAMKKNYVIYYPYEPFKQMYPDIVFNVTKESGIHYLRIAADRASWKSTIEYHNNQKIYIIQWEESENSYILGYWVKDKKNKTYVNTYKHEKDVQRELFELIRKDSLRAIISKSL